ncbi:hypothetical protein TNIN_464811 [Trichonephila inaurata madagascariensis]|uniref:Uncharacterized protein n=1 Tax=Trichonephila inaurata madagascariensis TaxID=2747483 RepID=A0A8X6I835_9ARAC|nr:hypothetical protein TNIN_464811 [Trichonephila inaurata madagascariensis]
MAEDLNEPHRLNQVELSDLIEILTCQNRASGFQTVTMKFTPTRRQGPLSTEELGEAKEYFVREVQQQHFKEEISLLNQKKQK